MKNQNSACFKKTWWSAILLLLSMVLLSGCALLPTEREPLPPPLVEPPEIRFNLHEVGRGDIIHQVIGAGIFIPVREYTLSFLNNAGRLQEVHGIPGMQVEEGQVLAELESEQLEFDIAQMEIDLTEMRLRQNMMRMDYDRMVNTRRALRQAYETETSDQNRRALDDINHSLARFEIDLEIQNLNIEQHEMHINRAKERLEATRLVSPIDGLIVSSERFAIGEWINAYHELFTVADPTEMFLRYSPAVTTGFEVGMTVRVDIEGVEHMGTIVMTPHGETEVDIENPRFEDSIIIQVEDIPDTVTPGDDASIRIIFQERRDVITIPRAALRTMGARNYVVVRKDEMNREVDVELGVETPTLVEIAAGLEGGEQIVLR